MDVPVKGLAAILFSCLLGVRGRASWELFLDIILFHHPFSEFSMGSMYGAYVVSYKQDLILENLHLYTFILFFCPNVSLP